eukprot:1580225-Rhodomonas_salina.1
MDPAENTVVDTRFALYEVASDEQSTAEQITAKTRVGVLRDSLCKVTLMPTHHIDAQGYLNGFRLIAPADAYVGNCPFTQRMFYGVTICECKVGPAEIAALIADPQAAYAKLEALVQRIEEQSAHEQVASTECIPNDQQGMHRDSQSVTYVRSHARRA